MADKYSYRITPLAEEDIDGVLAYIANNLCNTKAAKDLLNKIDSAIDNICNFPYSFADCSCYLIADDKIRHIPVDNYVLIYEITEYDKEIRILRFRYAKMNLRNIELHTKDKS